MVNLCTVCCYINKLRVVLHNKFMSCCCFQNHQWLLLKTLIDCVYIGDKICFLRGKNWFFYIDLQFVQASGFKGPCAIYNIIKNGKKLHELFSSLNFSNTKINLNNNSRSRSYRRVNTLRLCYGNQSDNAVLGNNRCLFWDPYKMHKCSL